MTGQRTVVLKDACGHEVISCTPNQTLKEASNKSQLGNLVLRASLVAEVVDKQGEGTAGTKVQSGSDIL
jgi:hypothetical protein